MSRIRAYPYPAKILLLGEYTVLNGSRALAIPAAQWSGKLDVVAGSRDPHLAALADYLDKQEVFTGQQRSAFREAIEEGLRFSSDIPQGYGVGSSGALCAAIFDHFFRDNKKDDEIAVLRAALATVEGFFHGTSSGVDPLVSLTHSAILHELGQYHVLRALHMPAGLRIWLIDSGTPRITGDLVQRYRSWTTDERFVMHCLRPLTQSTDHAIAFFIENETSALFDHLKVISALQYTNFRPMIPSSILPVWKSLLDHPDIAIKLCGAGGGGFFLAFSLGDNGLTSIPLPVTEVSLNGLP